MASFLTLFGLAVDLCFWIIIIQVILSWLINFDVVNLRQPFVYQLWTALNRILDPFYRRIRQFLPNLGGLDLAPLVLILGILFIQRLILVDLFQALA